MLFMCARYPCASSVAIMHQTLWPLYCKTYFQIAMLMSGKNSIRSWQYSDENKTNTIITVHVVLQTLSQNFSLARTHTQTVSFRAIRNYAQTPNHTRSNHLGNMLESIITILYIFAPSLFRLCATDEPYFFSLHSISTTKGHCFSRIY